MATISPTAETFRTASQRLQDGDIDGFLGLCADDVLFEFPFSPPQAPRRLAGKETLSTHLRRRGRLLEAPRIIGLEIYTTDHPGTIIAETTLQGATGADRRAIAVVTITDGRIATYRDYYNPLDVIPKTAGHAES
jgi:ketosteroid isomerase-like protein